MFGVKGYMVWLPEEGKCTTSKNVVFREDEVLKDLNSSSDIMTNNKSTITQKKKSWRKIVTFFDTQLIQGPTPTGFHNISDDENGSEASFDTEDHEISSCDVNSSQGGATPQGGFLTSQVDSSSSTSDGSEDEGLTFNEEEEDETEIISQIDDYLLAKDRDKRQNIRPPSRYEDADFVGYALSAAEDIETENPKSMEQVKKSPNWKKWHNAEDDEMTSLMKNHT
ncbi:unnamed protein product [Microthlaspi erraticum]|uniref:Uncharacterized protein n=1 Tax=Microthlaspi erraticum TaxID=1685480 RepID=A0A6D2HMC5_9BRAS|nr:unnamed protein product [Microthlaspi erraticum]